MLRLQLSLDTLRLVQVGEGAGGPIQGSSKRTNEVED